MNRIVGLHDADHDVMPKKTFPNLALMKISTFHKQLGDQVEWWSPLFGNKYDIVYSSKIFDYTPVNPQLPKYTIKGGTGYGLYNTLDKHVDECFPDYSIYPKCDYAIGYLTRGCPNTCGYCIVPKKEGDIYTYNNWRNIIRSDSKKLVLMDNNILASQHGIEQLTELADTPYYIDLNQGMDASLVAPEIAYLFSKLKWILYIRLSCDTQDDLVPVIEAVKLLERYGVKSYKVFVYLLVTKNIIDAHNRLMYLKDLGVSVYAQPLRLGKTEVPNRAQKFFARFVYYKWYKKVSWKQFCQKNNIDYLNEHCQQLLEVPQ